MNLYIAADHRGFELKNALIAHFPQAKDLSSPSLNPEDDYIDFAETVCRQLQPEDKAILLCGSGHGMDIVANRFPHVRAIIGFNPEVTKQGRTDEDANVLVIPAEWTTESEAIERINLFLSTSFADYDRYNRRLHKLANLKP